MARSSDLADIIYEAAKYYSRRNTYIIIMADPEQIDHFFHLPVLPPTASLTESTGTAIFLAVLSSSNCCKH